MLKKILVANRGEIAGRIIRTVKSLNITSAVVYSKADQLNAYVKEADEAYYIGESSASESYLDIEKIIKTARDNGVDGIHPGYGFLSENNRFASLCRENGIAFIGPDPEHIEQFGQKHIARSLAVKSNVPVIPGSSLLEKPGDAVNSAERIGYPVMLKSSSGGGGIGMAVCRNREELSDTYESIKRLAENNFKDSKLFLEKYIENARHVEVQVFGDGRGNVLTIGTRDCSIQRRNQKVVEEAPAPGLDAEIVNSMEESARRLCESVNYNSTGTVEFIYDVISHEFYFLEVNTRLQVEHCVTEEIFGIDLVEMMIRNAGDGLPVLKNTELKPNGHAIEIRLYAEDPGKNFQPSNGLLTNVSFPDNARLESWIKTGTEVTSWYDPLLAKVIVKAETREKAVVEIKEALNSLEIDGIETNLSYLIQVFESSIFDEDNITTSALGNLEYKADTIEVVSSGTMTTIQDYPGRTGYWMVGVPPSGPMDAFNFQLANRIVGNSSNAAAVEFTLQGATLSFNCDTTIVLTGARMKAFVDTVELEYYKTVPVKKGSVLMLTSINGPGQRAYLAVRGGISVPNYLGSKSTFTLGKFGGHQGRRIKSGDVLHIGDDTEKEIEKGSYGYLEPKMTNTWEIGVLYGPHGAPDFFTDNYIEQFFLHEWEVHFNSSRTGVRLIGPKPEWARSDGGEAGLHPSNIHDNAYAVGAIDFTGDMPIILGPDGPSLGGFVCPATIASAEYWKVGQLKPGDTLRFRALSLEQAETLEKIQQKNITDLSFYPVDNIKTYSSNNIDGVIIDSFNFKELQVCVRRAGDKYILIEFGEKKLDIALRFEVQLLFEFFKEKNMPSIIDLTPGIRSLQIHYDSLSLSMDKLLQIVKEGVKSISSSSHRRLPSRIVHLPLSWDDESTRLAIEKYDMTVRKNAPWFPNNIEFIRRINGLDSIEDVKDILFNARYMVLGLGDVYLGAPVATPIDPRHRLVTTKYNPARTWTPENAVGIGGAYLCVYGMEGPGGYQFVGRTVQMWNRYNITKEFESGKPWLLRFFDQIQFYPVSHDELMEMRRDFPEGGFPLKIEESSFDLDEYLEFLDKNERTISAFKEKQQNAFDQERRRWEEEGQQTYDEISDADISEESAVLNPGSVGVEAPVSGSIWKVVCNAGDTVYKGDTLVILESMKMEIRICAERDSLVDEVYCQPGKTVKAGDLIAGLIPASVEISAKEEA